jgi:hypothetical protein
MGARYILKRMGEQELGQDRELTIRVTQSGQSMFLVVLAESKRRKVRASEVANCGGIANAQLLMSKFRTAISFS